MNDNDMVDFVYKSKYKCILFDILNDVVVGGMIPILSIVQNLFETKHCY